MAWMLTECGVSLYAAAVAHSPLTLAFGCDSLVELLSATIVLLQFVPRLPLSQTHANRAAGWLLFALSGVVTIIAALSLALRQHPSTSRVGIGVTACALVIMPAFAWLKRREALRSGNSALAADAVQSATCAYLAALTLSGLAVNAIWQVAWFDSFAALLIVPLLLKQSKASLRGNCCGCYH